MRLPGKTLLAILLLAMPCFAEAGSFRIDSPDFESGGMIPARFTCEGENVSPRIAIYGVPAGAKSLALVVEDPDAPSGIFTHWIVWNITPPILSIGEGAAPAHAVQGTNDFGKAGYSGPCPPSGTHRYYFRLSALDIALPLKAGASRKEFDAAINGHVLARAAVMGRYAKGNSH